ncbi:hypothetical protein CHS0354_027825 [Potamilus streckersoni]|uniref:Ubiquitin-like domain-containing protein n=1 Tax=Potamilus streckersoni TaxID=2493646 RepID=A0AAE0T0J2_9BIVA|nr:hypothetical protein CHS0354_027825 [Potamilus streckersoni]
MMPYKSFLEELKPFLLVNHDENQSVKEIKPTQDSSELESKRATSPARMTIQLIFKARSTFTVDINKEKNISLNDIKAFVKENDKIPAKMQLLLYEGHILQEHCLERLKNGDCIHVLCRGIGGMQCGSSDREGKDHSSCEFNITAESTEDEVQKWLLDVIHVPSAYIDNFKFLDGRSTYECQDYAELSNILSVPIGLARKIFYMRSRDYWPTDIDTSVISTWNVNDLSDYLKNVKYPHLKEILQEKCIDGLTFLTYSFSSREELKRDLGLQEGGLHLRLWSESRKLKESPISAKTGIIKTVASECMQNDSGSNNHLETYNEEQQSEQQVETDEKNQRAKIPFLQENNFVSSVDSSKDANNCKVDVKHYISVAESPSERVLNKWEVSSPDIYWFLQKKLCLCRLQPITKDMRELRLVSIGSPTKLINQNDLEKAFLFIILYDSKSSNVEKYLQFLWKKIIENISTWVKYLPALLQEKFKNAKGTPGAFNVNGKKVKLSNVHKRHYLKQIEHDIFPHQHSFLLIDDCILKDSFLPDNGFRVHLDQKGLHEYGFCFYANVKYLTFNSRDFFGEFTEFIEKHIRSENVAVSFFSQANNYLFLENNGNSRESKLDQETLEHDHAFETGEEKSPVETYTTEPERTYRLNDEISENKSSEDSKADVESYKALSTQNSADNFVINISDKRQNRRHFKAEGSSTMYHKDWVLDGQETGSGMIILFHKLPTWR